MTKRDDIAMSVEEMGNYIKELENQFAKDCLKDEIVELFAAFSIIRSGYQIADAWYDDAGQLRVKCYFSVLVKDKMREWDEEFIVNGTEVKYSDGTDSFITQGLSKLILVKSLRDYKFDDALKACFVLPKKETNETKETE